MSTWAWPLPPAEFHKRIFPWRMMHAPLVGPYLLGRHNALAGRGMYLSVVDHKTFRAEAQSIYEGILPDPGSRLLTWTWPRWIPLDESARGFARFEWLERELRKSKFPTLLVWGREDEVFDHKTFATRFKKLLPHAEGPELVVQCLTETQIECEDETSRVAHGTKERSISTANRRSGLCQPSLVGKMRPTARRCRGSPICRSARLQIIGRPC
jgi:pimeloyl-ACP methyl ester carboxylesterase